jgi:hypothetical protein
MDALLALLRAQRKLPLYGAPPTIVNPAFCSVVGQFPVTAAGTMLSVPWRARLTISTFVLTFSESVKFWQGRRRQKEEG